jgi:hypothetical protein
MQPHTPLVYKRNAQTVLTLLLSHTTPSRQPIILSVSTSVKDLLHADMLTHVASRPAAEIESNKPPASGVSDGYRESADARETWSCRCLRP